MLSLRKGMVLLLLAKHPFVSMKRWKGRRNVNSIRYGEQNNKNKHKAVLFPAGNTISR